MGPCLSLSKGYSVIEECPSGSKMQEPPTLLDRGLVNMVFSDLIGKTVEVYIGVLVIGRGKRPSARSRDPVL